jgi:hypothetical protein
MEPLFVEPSNAFERDDPYTGVKSFVVGGMSQPTYRELSLQYFDSAYLLIETIKRCDWADYLLVNPVLFLYRHPLELLLKSILPVSKKSHDLLALADQYNVLVLTRNGLPPPKWIYFRLKELAEIDPGSTSFRYAEKRDKLQNRNVSVEGEIFVDILKLQRIMAAIYCSISGNMPDIVKFQDIDARPLD